MNKPQKDETKTEKDDKIKPERVPTEAVRKDPKKPNENLAERNILVALSKEEVVTTAGEELPATPVIAEGFSNGEAVLRKMAPTATEDQSQDTAAEQGNPEMTSTSSGLQKQKDVSKLTTSVLGMSAKNVMTFLTENVPKLSKKFAEKTFDYSFESEADVAETSGSDIEPRSVTSDISEPLDDSCEPFALVDEQFYRDVDEIYQRHFSSVQEDEAEVYLPYIFAEDFIGIFVDNDCAQIFTTPEV